MRLGMVGWRRGVLFGVLAVSLLLSADSSLAHPDGVILIPHRYVNFRPLLFLRVGSSWEEIQPYVFFIKGVSGGNFEITPNNLYASSFTVYLPELCPPNYSTCKFGSGNVQIRKFLLENWDRGLSVSTLNRYALMANSFLLGDTVGKTWSWTAHDGYGDYTARYSVFRDSWLRSFSSRYEVEFDSVLKKEYANFTAEPLNDHGFLQLPSNNLTFTYDVDSKYTWMMNFYWFDYSNISRDFILSSDASWGWWFDSSNFILDDGCQLVGVRIPSTDNSAYPPFHSLDKSGKPKSDFEENWGYDRGLGRWVSHNGYLDGSTPPNFKGGLSGNWVFGINPNGSKHSDSNDIPEWYWDGIPFADEDVWRALADAMQNQYHFESEGGGGVDDAIRRSEVNAWLQMIEANTASSSRSLMGFSTAIDGLRGDVSGIKSDTSRMVVFGSEISQALQNNHTDLKAFLESKLSGGGSGGGSDGGGDSSGIISAVNSGVSTLGGKLDAGNTQRGQILTDVNGIVQNTGQVNDYLSQIKSLIATSNQKQDEIKQKQEEQKQKQDETKQKLDEIKDKIDEVKDEIGEKLEVEDIGSTSLDDSLSSVQESVRDGLGEKIDDQNEFSESLDDGSQYGLFSISLSSDPVWIEEDTYNVCGMEFDIGLNWNDSKWSWATQYRSFILLIQKLSLWLFTVFSAFRRLSSV